MSVKEYSTDKIKVFWEPGKCIHAAKCVKGLPGVFNQNNRPWINVEGASADEIREQVSQCPSGALRAEILGEQKREAMANEATKIQVLKDGPVLVHGVCEVTNSDGSVEQKEGVTALCRCGASSNKPYCDGTHNSNGFEG
jgi:uncharacterized Fe-S cluster protein YjdI